jgi:hypothetical protein
MEHYYIAFNRSVKQLKASHKQILSPLSPNNFYRLKR